MPGDSGSSPNTGSISKLLLDPGDFHSNPSGLLSFNKSATVLRTIAKIIILKLLGLGLIKINDVSANFNNPRPSLILNN